MKKISGGRFEYSGAVLQETGAAETSCSISTDFTEGMRVVTVTEGMEFNVDTTRHIVAPINQIKEHVTGPFFADTD